MAGISKKTYTKEELIDKNQLKEIFSVVQDQYVTAAQEEKGYLDNIKTTFQNVNKLSEEINNNEISDDTAKKFLEQYEQVKKLVFKLSQIIATNERLKKYFTGDEFNEITYLMSFAYSDTTYHTVYNLPLNQEHVKIVNGTLVYNMKSAIKKVEEDWKELKFAKQIKKASTYYSYHHLNYRNVLLDTGGVGFKVDRGTSMQAFVSHLMIHEEDNFKAFKTIFDYNNKEDRQKELQTLIDNYKDFYGDPPKSHQIKILWKQVSGEHAVEAWKHFIRARGNLSGLVFGDLENIQMKAGKRKNINLTSIKNLLTTLNLLQEILGLTGEKRKAKEECVDKMINMFTEKAYPVTEEWLDKILDEDNDANPVVKNYLTTLKEAVAGSSNLRTLNG